MRHVDDQKTVDRTKVMKLLPLDSSDADLIAFADRWASLMESEDYTAAFALTEQFTLLNADMNWTPEKLGEVVKACGRADANQKVTLEGKPETVTLDGKPTVIPQRKEVHRFKPSKRGAIGEICYDLNIDGLFSDLTVRFWIMKRPDGLAIELNDIAVHDWFDPY